MDRLSRLQDRIIELSNRRQTWDWPPDNSLAPPLAPPNSPLAPLEAEITALLDELVYAHVESTDEKRDRLRKVIAENPGVHYYLYGYIAGKVSALRSTGEPKELEKALVAITLEENNFGDYRDMITLVRDLRSAARHVGIDDAPYFGAAAKLASSKRDDVRGSMQEWFASIANRAWYRNPAQPAFEILKPA